jgi:HTH-type transcriptional regulator/antitoxin HigA
MDATLILIDSDAELARVRALVERLWQSDEPGDIARLQAQARLIAAYEESKWPRRSPSTADLIRHLMDQHGLTVRTWWRSWEPRAASARSCAERRA